MELHAIRKICSPLPPHSRFSVKRLAATLALLAITWVAQADTIVGTVRAQGKEGGDEAGTSGKYDSRKYKFAERMNYAELREFVVYIEDALGTNVPPPAAPVQLITTRKISQKPAMFSPHVLPVMVGTDASFTPSETPVPGSRERIMVVDDEEPLVEMMQQKLSRLGYEVVAHHDSVEALTEFQLAPRRFDLVITDQTMPRLTGGDLAKAMVRVRSDIPVIICSGSGQVLNKAQSLRPAVRECILKPVNFVDLSRTIRRVLEDAPRSDEKRP